ncbi:NAD(P)/FAD-dependent oxidoreductase [Sphingomonas nostoxanthinifaciens]|uniref:NAD(P)/FAD-dependent oxidoreductase n=1 Tax=Sphingomonas nostoxanthinifaciens TaxID=2872652 RepID=UPI001CC1CD9D|nr:FAD-dependent oxidoreductase [Sphingomonas nostoxanthinifaciens]UAK25133.1 FAD-binding oxidoreductase [Sphingomonas nostoxanthinifaciens]
MKLEPLRPDRNAGPELAPPWGARMLAPERAPLREHGRATVAIIGGGVAGLSTALHLGGAGLSTVLLEAECIGAGAAGSSAGIVAPQPARAAPDAILRRLGPEAGAAMLQLIGGSGTYLFDLIARQGIACDAVQAGFLAPMTASSAAQTLERRVAAWGSIRTDLRVCDAAETAALTGCRGYRAALLDPTGGALDPVLYLRGLADRAEAAGVQIHERSPVIGIERAGRGWRLWTGSYSLLADQVVLAANGGNMALRAELAGTVLPLPVIEVATEPLPPEMRAVVLPGGHSMTDQEPDVFSIRYTADGRLITALPGGKTLDPEVIAARVNRRLKAMLASYRPLRLDHVWQGTAWVNGSLMPRLVRVDRGMIAIQACNGRGLAINTVLGREVARTLTRGAEPLLALEPPRPVAGFVLARHLPRLLMSSALVAKRIRSAIGR